MKRLKFKKIDAFAANGSDGNPAGYISLASLSDITAVEMQTIARELKGYVNEVGFIAPLSQDEFVLKYFSSEREVDFCGHATIAIMYDVLRSSDDLMKCKSLTVQTNRGRLIVENRIQREDAVFIMSPVPEEKNIFIDPSLLAEKLKINEDDIDARHPLSVINAGLTTLLVPITNLKAILDITPDLTDLKMFCVHMGVDIIEVFTADTSDASHDFRTRVFAPTFGYLEDPATGSGNAAFG